MKDKKIQLTREGLEKLKNELDERLTAVRKEIADRIEDARRMGDLSENSAYKAALEDRTLNEKMISDLEDMISRAEIIEKTSNNLVSLGSKVTIFFEGKEIVYEVVGAMEADPSLSRISNESPIGAALMDKAKNDEVMVELPNGSKLFKIINVE